MRIVSGPVSRLKIFSYAFKYAKPSSKVNYVTMLFDRKKKIKKKKKVRFKKKRMKEPCGAAGKPKQQGHVVTMSLVVGTHTNNKVHLQQGQIPSVPTVWSLLSLQIR